MTTKLKPTETYLMIHMLTFGIVLLLPSNTFANPVYHTLSLIAREEYWGVLGVLLALFHFIVTIKGSNFLKIVSLSFITFMWSSIGSMFLVESIMTKQWNTGITYLVIAGLSMWLTVKISRQR